MYNINVQYVLYIYNTCCMYKCIIYKYVVYLQIYIYKYIYNIYNIDVDVPILEVQQKLRFFPYV